MEKIILIAGGTGLIGRRLQNILKEKGYQVRILTRNPKRGNEFQWDPDNGMLDEKALDGVHGIINLAGAGIADKAWTPARKKVLIDSRVRPAAVLREAMRLRNVFPEVYVSASAIGYYGNTGDVLLTEDMPAGTDGFMPESCIAWEQGAESIGALGIRTVVLRIGIVLSLDGGALPELARPLRFGVGGYFADGQAWWSWIHLDDVCEMFVFALENTQMEGAYNAVAPHPVRNLPLVKSIAGAMGRRAVCLPAPAAAMRLALGEMAAVVLNSNKVSAQKILDAGFKFQFPGLEQALKALFRKGNRAI